MLYFDSNYILKCYLPEPGGPQVRALAARPLTKSSSELGCTEVIAALHRKVREGSLSRPQMRAVWTRIRDDGAAGVWTWLPIDGAVLRAVEEAFLRLDAAVFLRSADAIHLATASLHGFTGIHSHDRHVLAAAPAFGLAGLDVIP